jgi:immune inhibitor A
MKRYLRLGVAAAVVLGLAVPAGAISAPRDKDAPHDTKAVNHDLRHPLGEHQQDLRDKAVQTQLRRGGRHQSANVVRVGRDYVELAREDVDKIFVVIAEFGDTRHTSYPDGASDAQVFDGPLHNKIPRPDRRKDNTTLWQADFDRDYYDNMYFSRMADYYDLQSSGRYSVEGAVQRGALRPERVRQQRLLEYLAADSPRG